uniref:Uncharacterized protein n=1 Tax=Acrobeloides nanus TaxID=290746 RepID=A0A914E6N3_9BILA
MGSSKEKQTPSNRSIYASIRQFMTNRTVRKRLAEFEYGEIKAFVAKKLFKIDGILCDEETKIVLVEKLITEHGQHLFRNEQEALKKKYGEELVIWLNERLIPKVNHKQKYMEHAKVNINLLKELDPLITWHKDKDIFGPVFDRIQSFAENVCSMVRWSLLIEPGRLRTHLSDFIDEFKELEQFFDNVDLTSDECSQKAFDANYLSKARNKNIECIDSTRVALKLSALLPQPAELFGDFDCPSIESQPDYGTNDFIHANYVLGGPLLNKFICTQAPLTNTIPDFWRMIWQERSEYIFMLCEATDTENLGTLGSYIPKHCPFYWPRYCGEELHFGSLIVKNERIDCTCDPLFNVTYLKVWHIEKPDDVLEIQHWQWDWQDYRDFDWPFRLLRRSRISTRPTVIHCMDGCSKTGTLVLIEIMLMQLLRGITNDEHPMLTSAVFLRLQRRHSIAEQIQYLYVYRTILHYIQPFIMSSYHRFVLGYTFKDTGFCGKFNQMAIAYVRKSQLM